MTDRKKGRDYSLNIVGESFRNPDGSSRQAELKRCKPGERIELRREPDNPHDADAVAVYSARGVQVGYIASAHAEWIGGQIDRGKPTQAIVECVKGGGKGEKLGLVIRVNYHGAAPQLENSGGGGTGCALVLLMPVLGGGLMLGAGLLS